MREIGLELEADLLLSEIQIGRQSRLLLGARNDSKHPDRIALRFSDPAGDLILGDGDLVTVTLEPTFALTPVLDESFDDASLARTTYNYG